MRNDSLKSSIGHPIQMCGGGHGELYLMPVVQQFGPGWLL